VHKHFHMAKARGEVKWHASVRALYEHVNTSPQLLRWWKSSVKEVPAVPPYNEDPTQQPELTEWIDVCHTIDMIMSLPPAWNTSGQVGTPINAVLDWPMCTRNGFHLFLDRGFNERMKAVLQEWGVFLQSPASVGTLNRSTEAHRGGWLSDHAMDAMFPDNHDGQSHGRERFISTFECDPSHEHYGYKSWDDFFLRRFREGQRPVLSPDDDSIVANACESAPYRLVSGEKDVRAEAKFWIKGQPYSLNEMLNGDAKKVERFVGGTIYQAFLSALAYHHWHAPINGTVSEVVHIDGTYYSGTYAAGFDNSAPNESQPTWPRSPPAPSSGSAQTTPPWDP
jgi:phosphatidylserine decarboxylase